tara:strand:- start:263 stop:832 length:570 start_codon:yes stop_codon:yes gene_type:complete
MIGTSRTHQESKPEVIDLSDQIDLDFITLTYKVMSANVENYRITTDSNILDDDSKEFPWSDIGFSLHILIQPLAERIFNKKLTPTYQLFRIYNPGAKLRQHRDRAPCEYSASLSILGKPWAFEFEEKSIITEPGKIVFYRGDWLHGRETPAPDYQGQLFLHWIDSNGRFLDVSYDRGEYNKRVYTNVTL